MNVFHLFRHSRDQGLANEVVDLPTIARFLPMNPIIVEAGAHKGTDSVQMATHWPGGKVYCFEPVDHVYAELVKNTSHLTNVEIFNLALGKEDRRDTIFVSQGEGDGSSSLLAPKRHLDVHPQITFERTQQIEVVSLDSFASKHQIERVDFLWLDMQGYELCALEGASRILESASAIYSEVSLIETYKDVPLYNDVRQWLESRGFQVEIEALPWKDMGNVLFTRMP